MTLNDVKIYLRVDNTVEDEFISSLMSAAESYLEDAVDNFQAKKLTKGPSWVAKAEQAERLLINDWYENRQAKERPVCSAVALLITQLQL